MKALIARWQAFAPREQWMALAVAFASICMLYVVLVSDPLAARQDELERARGMAESRTEAARQALNAIEAQRAADPNKPYRDALQAALAERQLLLDGIDRSTAGLVTPETMRRVLQDLLQEQPQLRLLGVQSFSQPLVIPGNEPVASNTPDATERSVPQTPVALYRHGVRLTLEGGYFDLLGYLVAVQKSGWRLHWESLNYEVGESGPAKARISLELYTLSRTAGWIGV
ncbi:type II secretion system protein GspM [Pseudomonas matsuisoli]|uniref:MSHA biogenesis protein MshJ n=1 Tax=Pseudomonas matsuisoli TaxID=1515666 RepID=A0A917Q0V6_9PSED|nr:type II secretion system protein GspM [Pseudomonas matsuisoli]GGK04369.1 MSHA biogenesis protein MshJ [Pseudomonas matsuisoli]